MYLVIKLYILAYTQDDYIRNILSLNYDYSA